MVEDNIYWPHLLIDWSSNASVNVGPLVCGLIFTRQISISTRNWHVYRALHPLFHRILFRVKVGSIAHMVWIAHCVSWVISRTLTAILPDLPISVACPSKMNSVTYFIPYPRDNSTNTYSILLISFACVAYFSDGRKSKNSVNFLVVSCSVVYIRACT